MDRGQEAIAFWLAYRFACGDAEPLPSMFTRKAPAGKAEPQDADHPDGTAEPAARPSILSVSNMTASYIIASVLLFFAAVDGAILTMANFSPDKAAAALPIARLLEKRDVHPVNDVASPFASVFA